MRTHLYSCQFQYKIISVHFDLNQGRGADYAPFPPRFSDLLTALNSIAWWPYAMLYKGQKISEENVFLISAPASEMGQIKQKTKAPFIMKTISLFFWSNSSQEKLILIFSYLWLRDNDTASKQREWLNNLNVLGWQVQPHWCMIMQESFK